MIQIPRRFIIGIVIVVVLVIVGITVFFVTQKSDTDIETANNSLENSLANNNNLKIDGLSNYPDVIDEQKQQLITDKISSYLSSDKINSKNITANVRKDSYKTETNDLGSVTSFMVDIPSLKRSYSVNDSNGGENGYNGLNVLCPTAEQRIYPKFDCKDDLSE